MAFDPKALRYDKDGVPFLTATEIEHVADEVLRKYHPEAVAQPCPTRIATIIQGLNENTGLLFAMDDLGYLGQSKVLGKVNFPNKILFLDICLNTERKSSFNFTAGHEIGHWILHRHNWMNFKLKANSEAAELSDDEESLCRLDNRSARDWLEYQANVFSANLIMPSEAFHKALIDAQLSIGIKRNLGVIVLSQQTYSTTDYIRTVEILSQQFSVSRQSVEVRLRTRDLVIEERSRPAKSVRKILMESSENF